MKRAFFTLLAILLLPLSALAGGPEWQNFSFNIDGSFRVERRGPADIYLYNLNGPIIPSKETGPLFELAVEEKTIYAKHLGQKDGEADPGRVFILTIPKDGGEPTAVAEAEFKVTPPPVFMTLREAHKAALRAGRGDYGEVDRYFLGQVWFLIWNLHFIAFYALLPGFMVGAWLKGKEKNRPFVNGWLICFLGIAGVIVLVGLISWLDMRFF